jgi:hypothetical protein
MKNFSAVAAIIVCFFGLSFAGSALANPPADDVEMMQISGKVVETMDSGGYTYVCIEKEGQKTWVAVPKMKVIKGQTIAFRPGAVMENFSSKTLNRTFDRIIFSAGVAGANVTTSGSKDKVSPVVKNIKVEKAEGPNAYTVAQLYEKAKKLDRKEVAVRGKVVKVSEGIMNKNWVHVQDGSGNSGKGTHDLVVTSHDTAAVGDIVTVRGTLAKDKDFGSGYKYKVIVEDATIKK